MKKFLVFLLTAVMALSCLSIAQAENPDVVILFTNDVHCAIDDNLGYASVAGLRDELKAAGSEVLVVDAGDAAQGGPVGTLSTGSYIIDIMNKVGYDVAVPGNHEFDYGMDRFFELIGMANYPYISCNFTDLKTGKAVLDAYKIFDIGGIKLAFVGISTPKTITSSTPAYFQDASGNWIYSFQQDETGEALYACVQTAVDAARAEGAQYVVALAHLGIEETCSPWMSTDVILNTTGIDAVIDGHSHSTVDAETVKNKAGKGVLLCQTGTKLAAIGQMTISGGKLSAKLVTEAPKSADVETFIADIKAQYDTTLNTIVARTDVDLVIKDPATGERIVRNAETNLGDLCADAYRAMSGADIAFVNGGGVRADIPAGDITYGQILNVHPFGNAMCMVEASGQEILDALEWSVRGTPTENGGFLQVSGLTFEFSTAVESTAKGDTNGMFVEVTGARRVSNVLVGGEPIDPAKTYTLASHNYMLKNGGDGYSMFRDNPVILDEVMLDNQVLINYITKTLNGVVGADYSNPYGQGRIVASDK